jgi:hypothetical protein
MICVLGVLLEGICAGTGFKEYLRALKWPSYSPPFWAWYLIGAVYYGVVFTCAFRILERAGNPAVSEHRIYTAFIDRGSQCRLEPSLLSRE